MAVELRIRDDVDVVRIINSLVDSAEALAGGSEADVNEARARVILSERLADALEAADRRKLLKPS